MSFSLQGKGAAFCREAAEIWQQAWGRFGPPEVLPTRCVPPWEFDSHHSHNRPQLEVAKPEKA
jgi:hypothetical protein